MTEREKMLAGLPYDCGDKELMDQWYLAKRLTQEYNAIDAEDLAGRKRILSVLLGGAGSVVTKDIPSNKIAFGNPCRVYRDNV